MLGYPPTPPGGPAADRPTRRPLRFGSTKGGGPPPPPSEGGGVPPPPVQPPKLLNTPRGHTLAGGRPRGTGTVFFNSVPILLTNFTALISNQI